MLSYLEKTTEILGVRKHQTCKHRTKPSEHTECSHSNEQTSKLFVSESFKSAPILSKQCPSEKTKYGQK